jgi:predicted AAA+ superfamily ATPase
MTMIMTPLDSEDRSIYVERLLDLNSLLKKKSHFLFGPRQTG